MGTIVIGDAAQSPDRYRRMSADDCWIMCKPNYQCLDEVVAQRMGDLRDLKMFCLGLAFHESFKILFLWPFPKMGDNDYLVMGV